MKLPRFGGSWQVPLALLLLLLAVAPVLVLLRFEFGPVATEPIAIDELYFMSCAARGLAVGEVPVAGCHDTKAPLVFLAHQLVQPSAAAYDIARVKLAAFAVCGLLVALAGLLAWRMYGWLAAVLASASLLAVFGSDGYLLALKTESIGSVFLLLALLALGWRARGPEPWQVAMSGVLLGLALMSKQSFVFALVPVGLWLLVREWWQTPVRPLRALLLSGLLGACALLPMAGLGLLFIRLGTFDEFVASTFVYPRVYAGAPVGNWGQHLAWKAGGLGGFLLSVPLVTGLAAAALLRPMASRISAPSSGQIWLVAAAAAGMVGLLLVAAVQFSYHLLPAWVLLSVLAGGAAACWMEDARDRGQLRLTVGLLVLAFGLQGIASWSSNGGKKGAASEFRHVPVLPQEGGGVAYVVGTWPAFYVGNRLVPASGVMYPNALPGAPPSWAYRPPDPATSKGRELIARQEVNAQRLLLDFQRTPPRYVMVVDSASRAIDSTRWTDIPVLETYLRLRCVPDRWVPGPVQKQGTLYRCQQ